LAVIAMVGLALMRFRRSAIRFITVFIPVDSVTARNPNPAAKRLQPRGALGQICHDYALDGLVISL
jgi:hypothetical protein